VPTVEGVLLVDDNEVFRMVLARSLRGRGYAVVEAANDAEALDLAHAQRPGLAVVDLNLGPRSSGLSLIPRLREIHAEMRIVVLTGYASIATAVEAIRTGATHYLAKPAEVDDILAAFRDCAGNPDIPVGASPLTVNLFEWELLQRTLLQHDGNISAAARALGLHRRSLQRKLRKHSCW